MTQMIVLYIREYGYVEKYWSFKMEHFNFSIIRCFCTYMYNCKSSCKLYFMFTPLGYQKFSHYSKNALNALSAYQ
jgi:hypothetical protein